MRSEGPLTPGEHKAHTEWVLVVGGFGIIVVFGGALMWLIYGQEFALIGLGVMIGVALLFAILYWLLKALEAWAKSS
ncbi:MAG: hypothetical protein M1531_07110 [Chloroflexi bacterium]|nr:hypothetical protein [Chloroflexota bacterium]